MTKIQIVALLVGILGLVCGLLTGFLLGRQKRKPVASTSPEVLPMNVPANNRTTSSLSESGAKPMASQNDIHEIADEKTQATDNPVGQVSENIAIAVPGKDKDENDAREDAIDALFMRIEDIYFEADARSVNQDEPKNQTNTYVVQIETLNNELIAEREANIAKQATIERLEQELTEAKTQTDEAIMQGEIQLQQALDNFTKKSQAANAKFNASLQEAEQATSVHQAEVDRLTAERDSLLEYAAIRKSLQEHAALLSPSLQTFAAALQKLSEDIQRNDIAVLTSMQSVKLLDQYVYRAPQPFGMLSREPGGERLQIEDLLRIVALQEQLHRRLESIGICTIAPVTGEEFDVRQHSFTNDDLIPINDDASRHNKVAAVKRIGYRYNDTILRKAEVKRYIYNASLPRSLATTPLPQTQSDLQPEDDGIIDAYSPIESKVDSKVDVKETDSKENTDRSEKSAAVVQETTFAEPTDGNRPAETKPTGDENGQNVKDVLPVTKPVSIPDSVPNSLPNTTLNYDDALSRMQFSRDDKNK